MAEQYKDLGRPEVAHGIFVALGVLEDFQTAHLKEIIELQDRLAEGWTHPEDVKVELQRLRGIVGAQRELLNQEAERYAEIYREFQCVRAELQKFKEHRRSDAQHPESLRGPQGLHS